MLVSRGTRKDLTIETKQSGVRPPNKELVFGKFLSDHMLEIDWDKDKGWTKPAIVPMHNLSLPPSASVFHYGLECFEGMKAYKDKQGQIRMFRPMENMKRFRESAARMALPPFDEKELLECIKELVKVDASFIPAERGFALYLRPTMISTSASLGVHVPRAAKIFCVASPVGPYYPTGWKPVSLYADPTHVRAWPGGTGSYKVGANYAGTILPALEADKKGFSQILWVLDGKVTEVGTMNVFFLWKNKRGEKELITPSLESAGGVILPGVTRKSVLELARKWNEFKVAESDVEMEDVIEAIEQGRLYEAFGTGTAAIVSPIKLINYKGRDFTVPLGTKGGQIGETTERFAKEIMDIQYGDIPSEWSIVVK